MAASDPPRNTCPVSLHGPGDLPRDRQPIDLALIVSAYETLLASPENHGVKEAEHDTYLHRMYHKAADEIERNWQNSRRSVGLRAEGKALPETWPRSCQSPGRPPFSQVFTQTSKEKAKLFRMGAIELRRGRGECLSHLQKALRHDLRTGENMGMVDERGFEPPASSLRTRRPR